VNWRAIGCGTIAALVFVGLGIIGLNLASGRVGCPDRIQWRELSYLPSGTPAPTPAFGVAGQPVKLGSSFIGLTTRDIYGPPGSRPSTQAADRPSSIAMDCADGTFLTYRVSGTVPTLSPGESP
jgi:hypothetical protein